jgi:hypothetical protein
MSSAINYLLELVKERHGGKNPGAGNIKQNITETVSTTIDIFKDIFTGNRSNEDFPQQIATMLLFLGSFGGMLFARKDRDTLSAKLFGNLRNLGGLLQGKSTNILITFDTE